MLKINWNNGMTKEIDCPIETAIEEALKGAGYTGESITISGFDIYGNKVNATLPWYGVAAEEDDTVTLDLGDFGFYREWIFDVMSPTRQTN